MKFQITLAPTNEMAIGMKISDLASALEAAAIRQHGDQQAGDDGERRGDPDPEEDVVAKRVRASAAAVKTAT